MGIEKKIFRRFNTFFSLWQYWPQFRAIYFTKKYVGREFVEIRTMQLIFERMYV